MGSSTVITLPGTESFPAAPMELSFLRLVVAGFHPWFVYPDSVLVDSALLSAVIWTGGEKRVEFRCMTRPRMALVLPLCVGAITIALFVWARMQYIAFIHPPTGEWTFWTDYTPFPLQLAGMLNVPVALFAQPLYRLVHEGTSRSLLILLLCAVVIQWTYIGLVIDSRRKGESPRSLRRAIVGTVGVAFGFIVALRNL